MQRRASRWEVNNGGAMGWMCVCARINGDRSSIQDVFSSLIKVEVQGEREWDTLIDALL